MGSTFLVFHRLTIRKIRKRKNAIRLRKTMLNQGIKRASGPLTFFIEVAFGKIEKSFIRQP